MNIGRSSISTEHCDFIYGLHGMCQSQVKWINDRRSVTGHFEWGLLNEEDSSKLFNDFDYQKN